MIYLKKKEKQKRKILYIKYILIFLLINNDMVLNNIKCKFMLYIFVFMIIYLYIEQFQKKRNFGIDLLIMDERLQKIQEKIEKKNVDLDKKDKFYG